MGPLPSLLIGICNQHQHTAVLHVLLGPHNLSSFNWWCRHYSVAAAYSRTSCYVRCLALLDQSSIPVGTCGQVPFTPMGCLMSCMESFRVLQCASRIDQGLRGTLTSTFLWFAGISHACDATPSWPSFWLVVQIGCTFVVQSFLNAR